MTNNTVVGTFLLLLLAGCSSSQSDNPASGIVTQDASFTDTVANDGAVAELATDASTSDAGIADLPTDAPGESGNDARIDSSAADAQPDAVADASATANDAAPADAAVAALAPMPLISRNVPAFASSGTAKNGNDNSYDTTWRSTGAIPAAAPAWIAYDLSLIPVAKRSQVLVAWYNTETYNWDHAFFSEVAYNLPGDYVIEGNAAPSAGTAPTTGWVTLTTVTGNTLHSRQHLVSFAGYLWIRMRTTKGDGSPQNSDVSINLDVHDASKGATDSWIFFGDSITAFAMGTDSGGATGLPSFGQLINAGNAASPLAKFSGNAAYLPAQEAAGIGGTKTDEAVANIDAWLSRFPGRFVCLSYGTNDVNANPAGVMTAYENFRQLATRVIAAGKIPCVPKIPWAPSATLQANAPALNLKIDALYAEFPQMVKGPDLYPVFSGQTGLFRDDLHPNAEGIRLYREAWAKAMLAAVYN